MSLLSFYFVFFFFYLVCRHRPHPILAFVVLISVSVQVLLLGLQDRFGPRWFVPCMFEPLYDYKHLVDALHVGECVICMSPITEENLANKVLIFFFFFFFFFDLRFPFLFFLQGIYGCSLQSHLS